MQTRSWEPPDPDPLATLSETRFHPSSLTRRTPSLSIAMFFYPFGALQPLTWQFRVLGYSSGFPDKNLSRLGARCELPSTRRKPLTWQFRPREKLTYKVSSKNTCGGFYVSLQESRLALAQAAQATASTQFTHSEPHASLADPCTLAAKQRGFLCMRVTAMALENLLACYPGSEATLPAGMRS